MNLENYHIDKIKQVFKSCYGLQNCISKQLPQSVDVLSRRTGFSVSFITHNLTLISAL